jgi:hypothetical protein
MANEIGPFTTAKKLVIFNPDNGGQVRRTSDDTWQSTPASTTALANYITSTSGNGNTASFPTGLTADRVYAMWVYDSNATLFSDEHYVCLFEPETRRAVDDSGAALATATALADVASDADTITTQTTAASVRSAVGLASANLDTQLNAKASQASVDALQTSVDALPASAGDATEATVAKVLEIIQAKN